MTHADNTTARATTGRTVRRRTLRELVAELTFPAVPGYRVNTYPSADNSGERSLLVTYTTTGENSTTPAGWGISITIRHEQHNRRFVGTVSTRTPGAHDDNTAAGYREHLPPQAVDRYSRPRLTAYAARLITEGYLLSALGAALTAITAAAAEHHAHHNTAAEATAERRGERSTGATAAEVTGRALTRQPKPKHHHERQGTADEYPTAAARAHHPTPEEQAEHERQKEARRINYRLKALDTAHKYRPRTPEQAENEERARRQARLKAEEERTAAEIKRRRLKRARRASRARAAAL